MIKNKSGVWGEVYAARYLRDRGYDILCSNYSCRFGEIDLIASKKNTLCFIEVKARNKLTAVRPMEAVDEGKQKRVNLTAQNFMAYTKLQGEMRFDVCEVYLNDNDTLDRINYIKNAF